MASDEVDTLDVDAMTGFFGALVLQLDRKTRAVSNAASMILNKFFLLLLAIRQNVVSIVPCSTTKHHYEHPSTSKTGPSSDRSKRSPIKRFAEAFVRTAEHIQLSKSKRFYAWNIVAFAVLVKANHQLSSRIGFNSP